MAYTFIWAGGASGGWSTAADWTGAGSPGVPGAADTAVIGPDAGERQTLNGGGAANVLQVTGSGALTGGTYAITTLLASNAFAVQGAGTTVTAQAATLSGGTVAVTGGAALRAATISMPGATTLTVDYLSMLEVGGAGTAAAGTLTVDAGAILSGTGQIVLTTDGVNDAAVVVNGTILATGGTLSITYDRSLTGSGTLGVGAGATLSLSGNVMVSTLAFEGANGTIALTGFSPYVTEPVITSTLTGFATGDRLTFDETLTRVTYTAGATAGTGTLTVFDGTKQVAAIAIAGDYTGRTFVATGDAQVALLEAPVTPAAPASTPTTYGWTGAPGASWSDAANWGGAGTPSAADTATIVGGTTLRTIVGGPGRAAALNVTNRVALAGTFTVGTLRDGGNGSVDALALLGTSSVTVTGDARVLDGQLLITQAGATLSVGGTLTLDTPTPTNNGYQATLTLSNGGVARVANLTAVLAAQSGVIRVDDLSTLEVGGLGTAAAGTLTVDAGATLSGNVSIALNGTGSTDAALIDNGTIAATDGALLSVSYAQSISGSGTMTIGANATLELTAPVSVASIAFNGAAGTLLLHGGTGVTSRITGFATGDAIRLSGTLPTRAAYVAGAAGTGTLTVYDGSVVVGTFTLSGDYAGRHFVAGTDGTIVLAAPAGAASPGNGGTAATWTGPAGGAWSAAANWTGGGANAPGATDAATVNGGTTQTIITGSGQAASLDITGDVGLGGAVTVGGTARVDAGTTAGTLSVLQGGALTAATIAVDRGTFQLVQPGATASAGTIGVGSASYTAQVLVRNGASLRAGAVTLTQGVVALDTASVLEVGGAGTGATGTLTVDPGATLAGSGLLAVGSASLVNEGTIEADGVLNVSGTGAMGGAGRWLIGDGGTLNLPGGLTGGTIGFATGRGLLELNGYSSFSATQPTITAKLSGLHVGDQIYLTDNITRATFTSNALHLFNGTTDVSDIPTASDYSFLTVNALTNGGTTSTLTIECFAAGTRLATEDGERDVMDVRVGDRLRTAGGALRPVTWVTRRVIDVAAHAAPGTVRPVRVRAHAFGRGVPSRDVLLSPDHAILVGGALIPVRYLIDGRGVVAGPDGPVTYVHLAMETHDVVFASGLPCETFLDAGQTGARRGAALGTDAAARAREAHGYAPVVVGGPALVAARAALSAGFPAAA